MTDKEFIRNFIDNSMKDGNDVYLSWVKLPSSLYLFEWHSLHDEDKIAEVKGSYYDGIVVEMCNYKCNQVDFFRLFHERNDFHLYEVALITDRHHSYSKITTEVCANSCKVRPINVELDH